jgi:hypothetical protein
MQRRSSSERYDEGSSGPYVAPRLRHDRYGEAIQVDCDDDADDVRRIGTDVGCCKYELVDDVRDIGCDVG